MAPPYAEVAPSIVLASKGWEVVKRDSNGSGFGDCVRVRFEDWSPCEVGGLRGSEVFLFGGDETKSTTVSNYLHNSRATPKQHQSNVPALRSPRASAASRTSGSSRLTLLALAS